MQHVLEVIRLGWKVLIFEPVKRLYLLGPSVAGFGFWKGAATTDICAELTSVSATHWIKNKQECDELIDRNVMAIVVAIQTVVYFMLLYSLGWYLWYRYFLLPPFLRGLRFTLTGQNPGPGTNK